MFLHELLVCCCVLFSIFETNSRHFYWNGKTKQTLLLSAISSDMSSNNSNLTVPYPAQSEKSIIFLNFYIACPIIVVFTKFK